MKERWTPIPAQGRRMLAGFVAFAAATLGLSSLAVAQGTAPPIPGVTGTLALEGTVQQEHAVANTIIVKTKDGVEHLFHYTKDLLVHGGKRSGPDALKDLTTGTTVAVHYTVASGEAAAQEIDQIDRDGLLVTEGTVIDIDRGRKRITIRFAGGRTERFELTDRAALDVGRDLERTAPASARVTVFYTDEAGRKVAHYFKKTS